MKRLLFFSILIISSLLYNGCSPTKNIKGDEVFLNSNKLNRTKSKIDSKESASLKESISLIIKPKTNKKLLGLLRTRLFFHNLAYKDGMDTLKHQWLRKFFVNSLGEPPVILDTTQVEKVEKNIKSFMQKEGFFNATVWDTIKYSKNHKKADVEYIVTGNEPFKIDSITYDISDPGLEGIIKSDCAVNSLIKVGDIYDGDDLSKERDRLTHELKQRGYYYFSPQYIHFFIPYDLDSHKVKIVYTVKRVNENKIAQEQGKLPENHHLYNIKNIYVQTDYNPRELNSDRNMDTVFYKNVYFISSRQSPKYNNNRLLQTIFFKTGEHYEIEKADETNKRLSDLGTFKFININFDSVAFDSTLNRYEVNAFVLLSPSKRQSLSVESEGTNQGGGLGVIANGDYRNKNTFSGFETFDIRPKIAFEEQISIISTTTKTRPFFNVFNTLQYGLEMTLKIPEFFIADKIFPHLSQHAAPSVTFSASYNQEIRPDYTRSLSNVSYGYTFKESAQKTWTVNLIDINYVTSKLVDTFQNLINSYHDPAITNSYSPHVTTDINFNRVKRTQDIKDKFKPYYYFSYGGELSGFLPTYVYRSLFKLPDNGDGQYELFKTVYSEYIKGFIDYRYYVPKFLLGNLALRGFAGAGRPFEPQTQTLPFEKAFYGGGANDIRGWIARTLGPGSYVNTQNIDQTGDIKLLFSAEYRFEITGIFQGALFTDAGNIWLWNPDAIRTGAQFKANSFYKEIAVGSGFGLRLNFNFFVVRFDEAWAVINPYPAPDGSQLNPVSYYNLRNMRINLGIGFPF